MTNSFGKHLQSYEDIILQAAAHKLIFKMQWIHTASLLFFVIICLADVSYAKQNPNKHADQINLGLEVWFPHSEHSHNISAHHPFFDCHLLSTSASGHDKEKGQ